MDHIGFGCITPDRFEAIDLVGLRDKLNAWGLIDGGGISAQGLDVACQVYGTTLLPQARDHLGALEPVGMIFLAAGWAVNDACCRAVGRVVRHGDWLVAGGAAAADADAAHEGAAFAAVLFAEGAGAAAVAFVDGDGPAGLGCGDSGRRWAVSRRRR